MSNLHIPTTPAVNLDSIDTEYAAGNKTQARPDNSESSSITGQGPASTGPKQSQDDPRIPSPRSDKNQSMDDRAKIPIRAMQKETISRIQALRVTEIVAIPPDMAGD